VTSKNLIEQALLMLPGRMGTKDQILECAVALYPQASQDVNPGFYKTLQ